MKSLKETAMTIAVKQAVKYARKGFQQKCSENPFRFLKRQRCKKKVNRKYMQGFTRCLMIRKTIGCVLQKAFACDIGDINVLNKPIPPMMNVAINSYSVRMKNIEKYGCNVP